MAMSIMAALRRPLSRLTYYACTVCGRRVRRQGTSIMVTLPCKGCAAPRDYRMV